MRFGWKVLIPISVLWILILAVIRGVSDQEGLTPTPLSITAGIIVTVAVLWILGANVKKRRRANLAENVVPEKFKPNRGGFPVPPLPGQEYRPARRTVVADVGASAYDGGQTSSSEEVRGG